MDFKMKNSLKVALFTVLFIFPLLVSANNKEVFEGKYLNLDDSVVEQDNWSPLTLNSIE